MQSHHPTSAAPIPSAAPPALIQCADNPFGGLDQVSNANTAEVYWEALSWDEWGNVSGSERASGAMQADRMFDPAVGHLDSIVTQRGATAIQSLSYAWDPVGNLDSREDGIQGIREAFEYDALNRLDYSELTAPAVSTFRNLDVSYDAAGNITHKSDVGTYAPSSRPHAPASAGGASFVYDANGNTTIGAGRSYTWSSFNKPVRIDANGAYSEFLYGPDRQRIRQQRFGPNDHRLIYYVGALYEEHHLAGGSVEQKHHISTPDGVVAIVTNGTPEYLHKDHLGSVDLVTTKAGAVTQCLSYDAFGKRRGCGWRDDPLGNLFETARGFTGHEHLDNLDLIHMNGRVYDPHIGRFISADPHIQFAENTQSYNRYAYVLNNPLSATDPSGFFLDKIVDFVKDNWRSLVAIGISFVSLGTGGYLAAFIKGFAAGMVVSRGDIDSALFVSFPVKATVQK